MSTFNQNPEVKKMLKIDKFEKKREFSEKMAKNRFY
jgi:hypothetical protein